MDNETAPDRLIRGAHPSREIPQRRQLESEEYAITAEGAGRWEADRK